MMETTSYKIKTYSPEFFDDEVKLIQEFYERKNLDAIYRALDHEQQINNVKNFREGGNPNFPFVPTDSWYAFDENDILVAFTHVFPQKETKRCNVTTIVTKEGYDDAGNLLFDHMVANVKERGYEVLVRNSTENHVIELEFLNKYGFEKKKLRNVKSLVKINDLNITKNDDYTLVDYEEKKHREKIINDLYLPKGYTEDGLNNQFDNLQNARDNGNVPSWVVALKDEEIVGQSIAFYSRPAFPYLVQFNTVTTNLEGDESIPLINAIYGTHLENLPDKITHIEHYLFGQVIGLRPIYERIGFKYLENHLYEKQI